MITVVVKIDKDFGHRVRKALVEGEPDAIPIAGAAQSLELAR